MDNITITDSYGVEIHENFLSSNTWYEILHAANESPERAGVIRVNSETFHFIKK